MNRHKRKGLMWFRADLRTVDNTALSSACSRSDEVHAIFIATPMQWHEHHVAPIQIDFIRRRLVVLSEQLAALGIPLSVIEVADFDAVPDAILSFANEQQIDHVYCNKQYEWNEIQRDHHVGQCLLNNQIKFSAFDDQCVIPPGDVLTQKGDPYKVFTPFRREWIKVYRQKDQAPLPRIEPKQSVSDHSSSVNPVSPLTLEGLLTLTYPTVDSMAWPVDEEAIRQRLLMFCEDKVRDYHEDRDTPSIDGTSRLSPYLATGMLSPRQCIAALQPFFPDGIVEDKQGPFCWLNEIIWREFYRHLMVAFPAISRNQPFQPWSRRLPWLSDEALLAAWQQGRTGFPIVDAAMRQLLHTGWMHNRLRMITASFLTKDLLIHWQVGEQWFSRHLIDGDLASNNGGWQWASSTGTDAQPYFRVFNPTTQGEKVDPKGEFIRTWVHELQDVPDKYIHQPHAWPEAVQGNVLLDYPLPIVDHKQARVRAIDIFKTAKEMHQDTAT
ncbi:deoxyribodipyrimidine photo-lyase [Photobacterium aphoticum]|uniref:Deoxyribodipyrimidine photo-lyase n=1 Tax=Photobacterium aphoticum TaxID=754436 RepID=A0A0J1JIU8_9GAMM|nr:deoxyribodipyrimidine photolyase [Photobacterium aphoticum]